MANAPAIAGELHEEHAGLPRRVLRIAWRTARAFVEDNVSRLGAALAFYTTVAVAPLMVLAVAVAGLFFDEAVARETVVREIRHVVGEPAANAVSAIESPLVRREGVVATVVGAITLLFGAMGVFNHLQGALNSIWRAHPPNLGFWDLVRYRLTSLAVVLATGFLLLVSLVVSAVLSWFATNMFHRVSIDPVYLELSNMGLSFAVITVLFALLFKLLPDTRVPWRHVWLGALVTAALFTLGKTVLSLYLAHARLGSVYGAASSLVALLLWCYYAAQIVFLGAEFTRVATLSRGGRDFSRLEEPLQRYRLAHVPEHGRLTARIETSRRRRRGAPHKAAG
ncbi:MAG TPA: YihY/virulence factor BrkB family protein [Opitutaceae bacterium]|nr:YihY/virulence factor BrkB family protein [Opitutaceae bacterium]